MNLNITHLLYVSCKPIAPVVQLITPRNLVTLGREFESRRSHTDLDFLSHHAQQVGNDFFLGTQNSTSRSTREKDG